VSVEITVGIPTHNRRETVLMALASSLEQTRPPTRVFVVADGCTDGTQEAVRELGDDRVEVLDRPKGSGCGYAHRNEVLERAGQGIVAWLADDDLWLPDHLERVGELFDANAAEIVNSMACLVREDGKFEPLGTHWRAPTYRDRFLNLENRTPSSAVTHRAGSALAVGGWPTDLERAGDWDLWRRMVRGGAHSEMVLAPTVLFFSAWRREQNWSDRVAQNAGFLARLRDPAELARLRGEMAFACSAGADADGDALAKARERETTRERELAQAIAARDRMARERDRLAAELDAVTSGTWWRMRRPFEPALRMRRRLRGRVP
jgi:glycosyltransferase involved in cell wall biosynthesis